MFPRFFTLVHRIPPGHVLRAFVPTFSLFAFLCLEMLKLAYPKFDSSAIETQQGCLVRLWHPHKTEDEENPKQLLVYPTVTKHARTRTVELKAFFCFCSFCCFFFFSQPHGCTAFTPGRFSSHSSVSFENKYTIREEAGKKWRGGKDRCALLGRWLRPGQESYFIVGFLSRVARTAYMR